MAERFIWNLDTEYFVVSNSDETETPNKIVVGDNVSETDLTHQEWLSSSKFKTCSTLTLIPTAATLLK